MARRFKLRISRLIPSFQSCRSKDLSTLPGNPIIHFFSQLSTSTPLQPRVIIDLDIPLPPKTRHSSSLKRHVSSAITSVRCVFRSRSTTTHCLSGDDEDNFKWKKDEKWHVIAKIQDETTHRRKIYNSSVSGDSNHGDIVPHPPPPRPLLKKKLRTRKKKTIVRGRTSTSSVDSGLYFSSEGGDEREEPGDDDGEFETETLVSSSRSFSTDLEIIPPVIRSRKEKRNKAKKVMTKRVKQKQSTECESPARLSVFQRLIPCSVDGKVRESFAVVKKSEDPYEDFKGSMMEMITEKQMFEEKDLEQLLHCFLSLNSRNHHGVIVDAFSEIWEIMFCKTLTDQDDSIDQRTKFKNVN